MDERLVLIRWIFSQVKLQTNKEQLSMARKQCDSAEECTQALEEKVSELTTQLDAARSHCTQLTQEKELIQKNLDAVRSEKIALDKNRVEINAMVS